uniref:HDC04204 n=1 Tax=Drosophila melanogaster TaxID=7227 RepID=Q6IGZ0_DROME|nr:TPA_inf: HDC04204 [Drosophila melanogaster]
MDLGVQLHPTPLPPHLPAIIVSGQRFTRGAVLARPWPMPNTKYPLARTHKQKCVNSQDTHNKCAPPHRPTTTPPTAPTKMGVSR